MFRGVLFRCMLLTCLSIHVVNGRNNLGLHRRMMLLKLGYKICGHLYEPPAVDKECCYDKEHPKFFYKNVSICCNGEVNDKYDKFDKRRVCCNGQVVNDDDFICCQNTKHQIPSGFTRQEVDCCGNVILTKNEMCCFWDDVGIKQLYSDDIGCCNGKPFNKRVNWCQDGQIMDLYKERCGNQIIKLHEKSCCNGVVNDSPVYKRNNILQKNENRACCGESSYNISTHTCCPNDRTIIPKDPDFTCCGTDYFNITSEICCDGKVHTKQYGKDSVCCGHEQMNTAEEGCCSGESYDKSRSKCCFGHAAGKIMSLNALCCDGQEVTEDSLCCNSISLIKKSDPTHDSCCLSIDSISRGVSYNSTEKLCKDGVLWTKRPDGKELCGRIHYDPTNFICCNNQLTPFIDGTRPACCGFSTIDENKQKCCKENTIEFPTDEGICCFDEVSNGCLYNDESCSCTMKCNDKLYNPNSEICCGEKLYKKTDVTECCGPLPLYNNGKHTCCNGVRYNGSRKCCGRRVLKHSETCCGDFVVQKSTRRSQKCCQYIQYGARLSLPYDPLFSDCNENGNVVSKPSKIYSPKCRLSRVHKRNDLYGWIPAACNSKYGFLGTITKIKSKWDKSAGRGYQTVTLTDVRKLKGRKFGGTTLKFRTEYTKSKPCFSRFKNVKNITVAIFTSATFESGFFDFVDHEISGNDIQYSNNEFYVVKVTRHVRHSFHNLKRSQFCQYGYQYRYKSLIR